MSLQSRREYLEKIRGRYERGGRLHQTKILDEFCYNCGYHRKHAVRLLSQRPKRRGRPGPRRKYGQPAVLLLKEFWLSSDQMCSKRLKEAAPDWLPFFKASLAARPRGRGDEPGNHGPVVGSKPRALGTQATLRDQARFFAQKTYPDPHRQ